jgi:2-isopropylmalate synthase
MKTVGKYRPFPVINLTDRTWPNKQITKAPIWCSVDLRDGNQALPVPMGVAQKIEMFEMLVKCGFKEIEVGFPASSPTEFEFVRRLVEDKMIPDDVTIQVLVQAREDLIIRTFESLVGVKRVIVHMYNSISPSQRRIVFGLEKPEIIALAVQGTKWVKEYAKKLFGSEVLFQYSPESFSATEVEFALEVCEAVMSEWQPTCGNRMIINLPCTVEVATPNVYADQIEWFCRNMTRRDSVIISVHTHNDRGTGVAATELGLMAGADRVEGTLFGNGERTGNLDIVTVALNLYTQGIDPELDLSDLESIRNVYETCTGMTVPQRQPYSGELVFTAFSGSHQDAIRKGLRIKSFVWDVPYLIIDPKDIGRKYDEVIRINGQSGKGGIAYLLENGCGINLPKDMIREFGSVAGKKIDALGREVSPNGIRQMFWEEYVDKVGPYRLKSLHSADDVVCHITAVIVFDGVEIELSGNGNGPIHAFINSLNQKTQINVSILDQAEHALGQGAEASAVSYVQIKFPDGIVRWGAGVNTSIPHASIYAVISAINRR